MSELFLVSVRATVLDEYQMVACSREGSGGVQVDAWALFAAELLTWPSIARVSAPSGTPFLGPCASH